MNIMTAAWCVLAGLLAVAGLALIVTGLRVLLMETHAAAWRRSLAGFEARFPHTATVDDVARWLGALASLLPARRRWSVLPRRPLCVEVTATAAGISSVVLAPARLRADLVATLAALVPGARLTEQPAYGTDRPYRFRAAVEARLTGGAEVLAVGRAADTSSQLLAALQPIAAGEVVRVQWLLTGARPPRWITDPAPEGVGSVPAVWATGDPVLSAVCRIAVATPAGGTRARLLVDRVWAALSSMNTPAARIRRRWLPARVVAGRVLWRSIPTRRWPIVATTTELSGLLGLVTGEATLPGVPGDIARVLPPPVSTPDTGVPLAAANYPGTNENLRMLPSDRLRHMWILGPPGAGKSTLLLNMMAFDAARGSGFVFIDAGGDLVADILDRIPPERRDDVILIDPTEGDHVIGINPLAEGPPAQAAGLLYHLLSSVYAQSWGPRTADIVRASLLTLTATTGPNGERFTLIDVPELLTNARFRGFVTAQQLSPQVRAFWRWYDSMPEPQQRNITAPILNKLRTLTLSGTLRGLLGQSDGVTFTDVLDHRRIVLVSLKKGLLGMETSSLIGALVIASVWQAALARADRSEAQRPPCWLFIDEFQDMVRLPLDIGDIAAQARRMGLGLVLAHQYLTQLTPAIKGAVLGAVRSHVTFQLGHADAAELAPTFDPLTAADLRNLGAHEIAARLCIHNATMPPTTGTTYPPPPATGDGAQLAEESLRRYGLRSDDVEQRIAARTTPPTGRSGGRANRIIDGGQP